MPKKITAKQKQKQETQMSIEEALDRAENAHQDYQVEEAAKYYEYALKLDEDNTAVLDSYAAFLTDMDDFDRAKKLLEKSIRIAPDEHFSKWMQLGQILGGKEAVKCFDKGVNLLKDNLKETTDPEEKKWVKFELAAALCSWAEMYLTDECFDENAEPECERLLSEALKFDPNNVEALQTLASVRVSQHKRDEALQLVSKSYDQWKDLDLENMPSYDFRHNTAKLFEELGEHKTAVDIWEGLVDEDDNIAEVYYCLALAYSTLSTSSAVECLDIAKDLLKQSGVEDPTLLEQITGLDTDIKSKPEVELYSDDEDPENDVNLDDEEDGETEMNENEEEEEETMEQTPAPVQQKKQKQQQHQQPQHHQKNNNNNNNNNNKPQKKKSNNKMEMD